MRYLSLFSGVEAATVAWEPLGWEAVAFAEIEPFPSAVLAHHWPDVPNLGDVSQITEEMLRELGHIDLVVGGSPCQSFSIAGLRKGLADPRGNMTLEFLRIISAVSPQYVVFENVPGLLSDKTGALNCLLDGLGVLGYSVDLQQLCASDFGLAQRRKRVFLVASLGLRQKADTSSITTTSTAQPWWPTTWDVPVGLSKRKPSSLEWPSQTDLGVTKKFRTCATTIAENLGKLSLITLAELSDRSQNMRKDSALQGVSVDIVPTMMHSLGMPSNGLETLSTWMTFWGPSLKGLVDHLLQCQDDYVNWDSLYGRDHESGVQISLADAMCVKTESASWSIEWLLRNLLVEIYTTMKLSTTSTWTKPIISARTYCFVEVVANIRRYMINLSRWPEALSVPDSLFLTMIDESMSYATKRNVKRFIKNHSPNSSSDGEPQAPQGETLLDTGDWASRPPILLERESLRGDTPPSREAREKPTDTTGLGTALTCLHEAPILAAEQPKCFKFDSLSSNSMKSKNPVSGCNQVDVSMCLDTTVPCPSKNQGGLCIVQPAETYAIKGTAIGRKPENGGNGLGVELETCPTLTVADRHAVVTRHWEAYQHHNWREADLTGTLTANLARGVCGDTPLVTNQVWPAEIACTLNAAFGSKLGLEDQHINGGAPLFVPDPEYIVRRLTPTECARLQGFPDNHVEITYRNKPAPDGQKYKAYGNSMAVNVMRYIGEQINLHG